MVASADHASLPSVTSNRASASTTRPTSLPVLPQQAFKRRTGTTTTGTTVGITTVDGPLRASHDVRAGVGDFENGTY